MSSIKSAASPHRVASVLLAEDDRRVRDSVARALELEGYSVEAVPDGGRALESVETNPPDLVILDVMMPEVDGLTACRRMRDRGVVVPILLLTARHELGDRVAGLDAGADDYLVKPFELEELLARLRALLRRSQPETGGSILQVSDLEIDVASRIVWRGGAELDLTKTEFDLLVLLAENRDLVLTREVLYERIWGYDFETSSKSLDVYVGYLRRKTEGANGELGPRLIQTVRGVGYSLRAPQATSHR